MRTTDASAGTASDRSDSGGGIAIDGLSVSYGNASALVQASLTASAGTVLTLLGPNGAGKSTLGRAVSGLVPIDAGVVDFDGTDIAGMAPHRIRRAGLAYIPEGRGIFPGLTVSENLRMGISVLEPVQRDDAMDEAYTLFPVLGDRRSQRAGSLSGGEQQMLALARVLVTHPQLIVADEMSLGLAPRVVDLVFETLQKTRESGITIILIEQFIHRALALADTCAILSRGRVVWSGSSVDARGEVLDHYLGRESSS